MSISMIQSQVTFEANLQSTPTSKPYLCIAHSFSVMNYRNRIDSKSQPITFSSIMILSHSVLIIIIISGINIKCTSLKKLESKVQNVLFSFLPIIHHVSIHLHGMQSSHILLIFIQLIVIQEHKSFQLYSAYELHTFCNNAYESFMFYHCVPIIMHYNTQS